MRDGRGRRGSHRKMHYGGAVPDIHNLAGWILLPGVIFFKFPNSSSQGALFGRWL